MYLEKGQPYYSREALAEAIIKLQDQVAAFPTPQAPVDNTAVIDGMSQEINWLKGQLADLQAEINSFKAVLAKSQTPITAVEVSAPSSDTVTP